MWTKNRLTSQLGALTEGTRPPPPAPPPPPNNTIDCEDTEACNNANGTRRRLAQTGPFSGDPATDQSYTYIFSEGAATRFIFFKGGWEPHPDDPDLEVQQNGRNIKGYYLGLTDDYSTLEGGVYVYGDGMNNKGEYRVARSAQDFGLEGMNCDANSPASACDSATDNGWVHVAMVYDGRTLTLFTDGAPNGVANFDTTKFGKPNLYYHPLSIGLGFAGQVDEARVFSEAVDIAASSTNFYCPMMMSPPPASLVANVPFNEGRGDEAVVFTRRYDGVSDVYYRVFAVLKEPVEVLDVPRISWARSRPDSLVGVRPDAAFTLVMDNTTDRYYSASGTFGTASVLVTVKDQCNFTHPTTTASVTASKQAFAFDHFASAVDFFFNSQTVEAASTPTPSRVTWTGEGARPAPHLVQLSITEAGNYKVTLFISGNQLLSQPLYDGIQVVPARASAVTTVPEANTLSPTFLGVPSSFCVQAFDEFNNRITVGGETFAASANGVYVSGVTDMGTGRYQVNYLGTEVATSGVSMSLTLGGVPMTPVEVPSIGANNGMDVKMFNPEDGTIPGKRVQHSMAAFGEDLLMFGGVDGESKHYLGELWRANLEGPHMHQMQVLTLVNGTTPYDGSVAAMGTFTRVLIDTTATFISPDCKDVRLADQLGRVLAFWITPSAACKSTATEFYVVGATPTMYLFYWSPMAETASIPENIFSYYWSFESEVPESAALPGMCMNYNDDALGPPEGLFSQLGDTAKHAHTSLYVSTAAPRGELVLDVSARMEGERAYYLHAYFYDAGGLGVVGCILPRSLGNQNRVR